MPASDLPLLIDAVRAAGDVARGFTGRTARRWDKPDGAGPVTEADLAVNDLLSERLRSARPDYGWLSEETEDATDRLGRSRAFIVDPIDGTRSFTEGSKTWAHSVAITQDGQVSAAVIYLPMRDMLFSAAKGQGAFLNGAPIQPSSGADLDQAEILAAKPALRPDLWRDALPPRFRRAYRPSLAYRLALVAQGRFDGMITLRQTWEWDIAAGTLILTEAGAQVSDRTGQALVFNNPTPLLNGVVAAGPALQNQIIRALAPS